MTITLNSYVEDCLSPFCLALFLRFCFILSFGTYSFISSFFLTLCVCFYVLGRSAISPCLERVALCRRYPLGFSSMVSLEYSRSILCVGCVCLLVVAYCGRAALWGWSLVSLALRPSCNCYKSFYVQGWALLWSHFGGHQ